MASGPDGYLGSEPLTLDQTASSLGTAMVALAPSPVPADEATFVAMINRLRASKGLSELRVDAELSDQARQWAAVMANEDDLHHSSDLSVGITADWSVLGENVGVHSIHDLEALFEAFVKSPTHYANLVDPRFDSVGVGVVHADNGYVWTTHRFMAVRSPIPPTTASPTPAPANDVPASETPSTATPDASPPTTAAPPTTSAPQASPAPVQESTPTTAPAVPAEAAAPALNEQQPSSSDLLPEATIDSSGTTDDAPAAPTAGGDDSAARRTTTFDVELITLLIDEVAVSGL